MFCATCGAGLPPGISFCNRCGASLKDHWQKSGGAIAAFIGGVSLIAIVGLGILLGGALTLSREAQLKDELIGVFMMFTFFIVFLTEIFLVRQMSRYISALRNKKDLPVAGMAAMESPPAPQRRLPEPVSSVTENTTRTLEYSRTEQSQ